MDGVLQRRIGGQPIWRVIMALQFAVIAFMSSGLSTNCALAASCQVTDNEVFGAGATFNDDRGSASDNDLVAHGDTVDNVLHVDASADTTFFNGTVDASGAQTIGFSTLTGITVVTATGTYNVPTGVNSLYVCATGGGGGGGGANSTTTANFSGTGGGGGGTACSVVTNLSASYSVTIGAGGAGGAANADGVAGGNTSFGSEATGLGGGTGFFAPGLGGLGSSCITADVCFQGGDGVLFNALDAVGYGRAAGGSSWRAGAAVSGGSGTGGSGGMVTSTSGSAGAGGSVVIFEYN